ncbi:hypothetical protein GLYMA_20G082500v4 [Glycine max]|uniref:Uncharacterized protein n=1 Tax=Glycine max TaxID=3847 RepID=A0A0R0E8J9_SOYBN|nr:hypothetical protein JHK86_055635 [Glycine max]KAG4918363.1 hypothetical protein JHK85_056644 [Glycine max]KAH1035132.1 hypothetical protein GYH30_055211 [Glycine max]KRG90313.1 hypothetical protein GLYMA_20G082500v4 [Glycine max]
MLVRLIILISISKSSMTGKIHPRKLILGRNPQQFQFIQPPKQGSHGRTHPPNNNQNLNHVRRQQLPSTPHEQPVRPPLPINLAHILLFREQRREYHPPRATPTV